MKGVSNKVLILPAIVVLVFGAYVADYLIKKEKNEPGSDYRLACSITAQKMWEEFGRAKYNDIFHEISDPQRLGDIKALKETYLRYLDVERDCFEQKALWDAYDVKWLKADREKREAEQKAREEKWASEIVDTGPQNLDAVLDGTFLSIPRVYLWTGVNEKDGVIDADVLSFNYPQMEAVSRHGAVKNDKNGITGLLKKQSGVFPCVGFKDKNVCQAKFFASTPIALDCTKGVTLDGDHYKMLWRRACTYREEPAYDADVGMWHIGSYYYEGAPEFPEYTIWCNKFTKGEETQSGFEDNLCEAGTYVGNIGFSYSFHRHLFWQHEKVRDAVRGKLKSFIVKGPDGSAD